MNIDILKKKLVTLSDFLLKHIVIIFIFVVVLALGYVTYSISAFSSAEPTADQVAEKTQSVTLVKIDPNLVNKIRVLNNQNVFVAPDYNSLNQNPFYR
jgi:flagellar basal body-associated protein FliL